MWMTRYNEEEISKLPGVIEILPGIDKKGNYTEIFPHIPEQLPWSRDNYGSVYVPKRGDLLKLDSKTIWLYKDLIRKYEGNKSYTIENGKAYIDGQEITEYEVQMDYYFMMGDNRHRSADSRYWGFVP